MRGAVGFRNMLAHGYADLVDERVYGIATSELAELIVKVRPC